MTDRELIELAAKAACIVINASRQAERDELNLQNPIGLWTATNTDWNPLTKDGDALRLVVQLGLEVAFDGDEEDGSDSSCSVGYPESSVRPCKIKYVIEFHNKDIFAATRRAIVRAAAEIGKQTY